MTTADGQVIGTKKIVDNGANSVRYNVVILGDGYLSVRASKIHRRREQLCRQVQDHGSVQQAVEGHQCAPRRCLIDRKRCGRPGDLRGRKRRTGATPKTYFNSTFCSSSIRRLLTCNTATALQVAQEQVPEMHLTLVVVNTPEYGGSGGQVGTFSTAPSADDIGLHEMGHTAFGLADEYEYYEGCASGEAGHDKYTFAEPVEPNVTATTDRNLIKWKSLLSSKTDPLPTTANANCSACDPQPNPQNATYVGAYDGARYFHCGCFRPSFDCCMRALGFPFCAVCRQVITKTLQPYQPKKKKTKGPPKKTKPKKPVHPKWTKARRAKAPERQEPAGRRRRTEPRRRRNQRRRCDGGTDGSLSAQHVVFCRTVRSFAAFDGSMAPTKFGRSHETPVRRHRGAAARFFGACRRSRSR